MRRGFVAVLAVMSLFAVSCSKDDDARDGQEGPTMVTVTAADADSTQRIGVGDQVVVELETSGGSGYSWTVTKNSNTTVAELVAQEQEKKDPDNASGMVGTPEVVRTTFEGKATGTTDIELGHVGPTGGAPEDTFTVTIVVE